MSPPVLLDTKDEQALHLWWPGSTVGPQEITAWWLGLDRGGNDVKAREAGRV